MSRDVIRQQRDATEQDARFRREVQIGLDAAAAGDLVPGDDVEAEAIAWRMETRRKLTNPTS
jgi:predicted transcriptional regulator